MRKNGFTLLELLVVITIIGILLAAATLAFHQMMTKSQIEKETKEIYADLMDARSQALFQKTSRSVTFSGTQVTIYPTSDGSGAAIQKKTYTDLLATNLPTPLSFDGSGASNRAMTAVQAVCVGPSGNGAAMDSVIISTTTIMLGKRTGGTCDGATANMQTK